MKVNLEEMQRKAKMYQVRSGVPIPEIRRGCTAGAVPKYPFREMEIGDCFDAPVSFNAQNIFRLAAKQGIRVTVRTVPGNRIRVWRVA